MRGQVTSSTRLHTLACESRRDDSDESAAQKIQYVLIVTRKIQVQLDFRIKQSI